jgi:hypothetical protein
MDLPKFVALLTSQSLWLTNAEILSADDPHEGTLSTLQFAHRRWTSIDAVPQPTREQIVQHYGRLTGGSPQAAFRAFVMQQEQLGIFTQFWRRNYYVSCWHAADYESVAMWKIYGAPGPGVAIVSNGARLEASLANNSPDLYLGSVRYFDERSEHIDWSNAFNTIMAKRLSFSYEKEVRLVHHDISDMHDPLVHNSWNDETMRFDEIVDDDRPLKSGLEVECDISILVGNVIVSPLAPPWYVT